MVVERLKAGHGHTMTLKGIVVSNLTLDDENQIPAFKDNYES